MYKRMNSPDLHVTWQPPQISLNFLSVPCSYPIHDPGVMWEILCSLLGGDGAIHVCEGTFSLQAGFCNNFLAVSTYLPTSIEKVLGLGRRQFGDHCRSGRGTPGWQALPMKL